MAEIDSATDEQDERLGKGYPYTLRPELHKALKARGVDYWVAQGLTFWNCPDGRGCVAYGYQSNGKPRLTVKIVGITDPEQAIESTLMRGMCHITPKFTCSECGHQYPTRNYESYETCDGRTAFAPLGYNVLACKKPNFCPDCGRRVKGVGEC